MIVERNTMNVPTRRRGGDGVLLVVSLAALAVVILAQVLDTAIVIGTVIVAAFVIGIVLGWRTATANCALNALVAQGGRGVAVDDAADMGETR